MAARLTYCSYSRYKEKRAYIVVFTLAAVAVLIVLTQLELIREKYGWQVSTAAFSTTVVASYCSTHIADFWLNRIG